MALANGVLVHGPTSWACAVRTDTGELKVVAERKRLLGTKVTSPFLRGPARLLESFAFLPRLKRALPDAKLPYERRAVLGSMLATSLVMQRVRRSQLGGVSKELIGGVLAFAPALLALRGGSLAAYHGAEHIAIGSYEHGEPRAREHERCGSHLVGPLLIASVAGNALASKAPLRYRQAARGAAAIGSVAAATETFGWMQRHPEHPVAQALARPGYELQHWIATAEPTREQLEVAEAALEACLELELAAAGADVEPEGPPA
jgi:uncharacterized protein YqhQ